MKNATAIEPNLADPEKEGCYLMFVAGFGPAEIEQRTSIPANRIRQWMFKEKWQQHKDSLEKFRQEKHPVNDRPMVKAVKAARKNELREKFVENMGEIAAEDAQHWKQLAPEERLVVASDIAALNGVHRKTLTLDSEEESRERGHINLTFLTTASEPGQVKLLEPEKVKEITDAE